VFFGHCFVAPFVSVFLVEKVDYWQTSLLPYVVGFKEVLFEINYYPI